MSENNSNSNRTQKPADDQPEVIRLPASLFVLADTDSKNFEFNGIYSVEEGDDFQDTEKGRLYHRVNLQILLVRDDVIDFLKSESSDQIEGRSELLSAHLPRRFRLD